MYGKTEDSEIRVNGRKHSLILIYSFLRNSNLDLILRFSTRWHAEGAAHRYGTSVDIQDTTHFMNSATGSVMYEYLWIISRDHLWVFRNPRACYCIEMPANGIFEISQAEWTLEYTVLYWRKLRMLSLSLSLLLPSLICALLLQRVILRTIWHDSYLLNFSTSFAHWLRITFFLHEQGIRVCLA
jgi:hypothetical protein